MAWPDGYLTHAAGHFKWQTDRQTEIQTCVPQNGMKYNTEVSLNTELKGTPNTMWAHTKSGYIKMAQ